MGAAASIPDTLSKEQARDLAGELWDAARFDATASETGVITREDFEQAREAVAAEKTREADEAQAELDGYMAFLKEHGDIVRAALQAAACSRAASRAVSRANSRRSSLTGALKRSDAAPLGSGELKGVAVHVTASSNRVPPADSEPLGGTSGRLGATWDYIWSTRSHLGSPLAHSVQLRSTPGRVGSTWE